MKLFGHKKQKEEESPIVIALRALGDKDTAVRRQARQEIAKCGTAIIPVLTQVVEDRSVENQWAAAQKSLDRLDYYNQEAVKELINDCKRGVAAVEKEANKRLKKLPRKTREAIIQMAELKNAVDKCQRRQRECVYLLGEIGTAANCLDEIAPILVKVLSYPAALPYARDVNEAAEELLVKIGAPAIPVLLPTGARANSAVKRILAKVGSKSIDEIVQALDHKKGEVRSLAAEVLGQIGGRAKIAVPGLVKALSAPEKEVRASAARAIARIGARQKDILSLIDALANEDGEVVQNVAKALGQLGSAARETVPTLMLGEAKAPKEVREALVKIGSEDASAIARELCDERKEIRSLAAEVLAEIGSKAKAAIPDLVRALSDPEKEVRAGAAKAIARIGARSEDVPSLLAALANGDEVTVLNIVEALGRCGGAAREAVPALTGLLKDEKYQNTVIDALGEIGDTRAIEPLLEYAFATPRNSHLTSEVEKALLKIVPHSTLTKEIVTCAMRASSYDHLYHEGWKYDAGYISLKASDRTLKKLCEMKSPVTSNILHLVAKKREISVTMDTGCSSPWEEKVSFAGQRKTALDELASRGSPPYDLSAFLKPTD